MRIQRVGIVAGLAAALAIVSAPGGGAQATDGNRVPTTRIVFSAWDLDAQQIYSVEPSGRGPAQLTFALPSSTNPLPSPDGRRIAFLRSGIWLMKPDGLGQHRLFPRGSQPAWAPDSKRLAFVTEDGLYVIGVDGNGQRLIALGAVSNSSWSPDGRSLAYSRGERIVVSRNGRQRTVARGFGPVQALTWSPDGRWIAYQQAETLLLVRSNGRSSRALGPGRLPAWSPDGRTLAFVRGYGLIVLNVKSGTQRTLVRVYPQAIAWSPDGGRIAYWSEAPLAIGTVTLTGNSRPVPTSAFPYAPHRLAGLAWTTTPPGLRYRLPRPAVLATPNELLLRRPVVRLAADGDRVAYQFCKSIGVWRPGDASVIPVRYDTPLCDDYGYDLYRLALAGDRVAWGLRCCSNQQFDKLTVHQLSDSVETTVATTAFRPAYDPHGTDRAGDLVGQGALLAFSTWAYCDEVPGSNCLDLPIVQRPLASQTLWRVREPSWSGDCPLEDPTSATQPGRCQKLTTEPGPLVPYDVDSERIAAAGDNAVVLLNGNGVRLRQILVKAADAQLSGFDLAVIVQGQLRHYDASNGALLHTWPFAAGTQVEDAARGLALYLLDGKVHLLRLSDGADTAVAAGTAARFGATGLFYAYESSAPWKGRIRFVPFDQLPLH